MKRSYCMFFVFLAISWLGCANCAAGQLHGQFSIGPNGEVSSAEMKTEIFNEAVRTTCGHEGSTIIRVFNSWYAPGFSDEVDIIQYDVASDNWEKVENPVRLAGVYRFYYRSQSCFQVSGQALTGFVETSLEKIGFQQMFLNFSSRPWDEMKELKKALKKRFGKKAASNVVVYLGMNTEGYESVSGIYENYFTDSGYFLAGVIPCDSNGKLDMSRISWQGDDGRLSLLSNVPHFVLLLPKK